MNEKIKEIAKQADVYVEEDWTFADNLNPKTEHFAQLIIRACGNFTDPVTRNLMMKHFGIEDQIENSKEKHTCPFLEEIYQDHETLCDCDEDKRNQCAGDIYSSALCKH